MQTTARDEELLEDIAEYFDMLACDNEALAGRGIVGKRENLTRTKVWREAAANVRSIKLV
jgi:hypothetical protein